MNELKRSQLVIIIPAVLVAGAVAVFWVSWFAGAFTGPTVPPGTGGGAIVADSANNVGIGIAIPQSRLHVDNGYLQLSVIATLPPDQDCQTEAQAGRMKFDATNNIFYICSGLDSWVVLQTSGESTVSARNVIAGEFGADQGGGDYAFPANVGIGVVGAPLSSLHVGTNYIQLETLIAGTTPPAADCDSETERGRMKFNSANDKFYICSGSPGGWIEIGAGGGGGVPVYQ